MGFFLFCFPVSSHSFAGRHTVHLECLKVLCCFPEFDEKDIGENTSWQRLPKCVGDAQRVTHSNTRKNPKWGLHEKYLCLLNFLVSTRKVSLSLVYKQMRGEFSREWLRVIWFLRAIEGKPKINTDFPRDNRFWWTLRMIYDTAFQWSVDSHWSNNAVRLWYSCLEEITDISQYFNFYILAEVLPKSYDCIHGK